MHHFNQVVRNDEFWNGNTGPERIRGLRGAKGLDVSDNLAVVAGSMDNAVVLFARHPNGTLSYLDSTFVGLRSVPSFHTAFNPKGLAPLSPLYKVSFTGEPSSILQGTLAQPSSHPPSNPPGDPSTSALPVSDGPARLELHEGRESGAAADGCFIEMGGKQYLIIAESAETGGGGVAVLALEGARGSQKLTQVQQLLRHTGVARLAHIHVPAAPGHPDPAARLLTFLAVATAHNDTGQPPRVIIHKWTHDPEPHFVEFASLTSKDGMYVSGMAHTVYQGQVLLAISCFTTRASYPHAATTESYVYRYTSISSEADAGPLRPVEPVELIHTLHSLSVTDAAFWEAPNGQLQLLLSTFLTEAGDVGGDVRVYEYGPRGASLTLVQRIAAQGPYDLEILHVKGTGSLLAIANRQVCE